MTLHNTFKDRVATKVRQGGKSYIYLSHSTTLFGHEYQKGKLFFRLDSCKFGAYEVNDGFIRETKLFVQLGLEVEHCHCDEAPRCLPSAKERLQNWRKNLTEQNCS